MKKALYMTLLLAAACLLGGLIGGAAKGYWSFLGTKIGFEFEPGNFLRTDFFSLTFGISLSLNLDFHILQDCPQVHNFKVNFASFYHISAACLQKLLQIFGVEEFLTQNSCLYAASVI